MSAPHPPIPDPADAGPGIAALLAAVRAEQPLVHSITNSVVTGFTANALLALGAAPAMVDIVGEAGLFAGVANGVLLNLGTPLTEHRDAMREAAAGARAAGTPWVLDPVAIGALPVRTALAAELLAARPTAIRGNASEMLALAGTGAGGRGVDSADSADAAVGAARALARDSGAVVAVSGPEDLVTDGIRVVRVAGGDPLLTRVTGGGCALGAVIAAFLGAQRQAARDADEQKTAPSTGAARPDPLDAVVAAHAVYGVAAERAAVRADGPGSFAVAFIDALAAVTPAEVSEAARVRTQDPAELEGPAGSAEAAR